MTIDIALNLLVLFAMIAAGWLIGLIAADWFE